MDLHAFVSLSVDELRIAFPDATLLHQYSGSGSAYFDADRMQQIIGNLVANSVAYGDMNQPIIITSRLEEDQSVVSVCNQGAVIPESLIATLFEPMTRGAETDSDARSVGLGLFIVKEIARETLNNVSADVILTQTADFDCPICSL